MSRGVTALIATASAAAAIAGFGLLGGAVLQGVDSAAAGTTQQRAAGEAERAWRPTAAPTAKGASSNASAAVPVAAEPGANAATVATVRVPRFGRSWVRIVRQGIGEDVLDSFTAGVGHYPGTAMPGGVGNFAIAGHDTGWGDAFRRLGDLRVGDDIRVENARGVYVYAFRNFRWVQPDATDVLLPVPERPGAAIGPRLITLTTCDPPYHAAERFVAYGELVRFVSPSGAERSFAPAPQDRAPLRAALQGLDAAPTRVAIARAVRGLGSDVEVTAERTSVGRAVPAMQVAIRRGGSCLIGQVGRSGVRTTVAAPVAGRCLIGGGTG